MCFVLSQLQKKPIDVFFFFRIDEVCIYNDACLRLCCNRGEELQDKRGSRAAAGSNMSFLLSRVLAFQGQLETKDLKESLEQPAQRVPQVMQVSGDKKVTWQTDTSYDV